MDTTQPFVWAIIPWLIISKDLMMMYSIPQSHLHNSHHPHMSLFDQSQHHVPLWKSLRLFVSQYDGIISVATWRLSIPLHRLYCVSNYSTWTWAIHNCNTTLFKWKQTFSKFFLKTVRLVVLQFKICWRGSTVPYFLQILAFCDDERIQCLI